MTYRSGVPGLFKKNVNCRARNSGTATDTIQQAPSLALTMTSSSTRARSLLYAHSPQKTEAAAVRAETVQGETVARLLSPAGALQYTTSDSGRVSQESTRAGVPLTVGRVASTFTFCWQRPCLPLLLPLAPFDELWTTTRENAWTCVGKFGLGGVDGRRVCRISNLPR